MIGKIRPTQLLAKTVIRLMLAILCLVTSFTAVWAGEYRQSDVDRFTKLLSSEDPYVRKSAAYHLSEMGSISKSAMPELVALLQDPVACGEAASALGKIGADAKGAVPQLIACLQNKELGYERCYAASALGYIGADPNSVVPALVSTVKTEDEPVLRRLAVDSLGYFGTDARQTIPLLIKQVEEGDKDMRRDAAKSIGKIGGTAKDIPALIALSSDEIDVARVGAAQALGKIGCESVAAVPQLTKLLLDPTEEVRMAAAQALGDIGPDAKEAIPGLKEAIKKEGDTWFRTQAAEAIEKIQKHRSRQQ